MYLCTTRINPLVISLNYAAIHYDRPMAANSLGRTVSPSFREGPKVILMLKESTLLDAHFLLLICVKWVDIVLVLEGIKGANIWWTVKLIYSESWQRLWIRSLRTIIRAVGTSFTKAGFTPNEVPLHNHELVFPFPDLHMGNCFHFYRTNFFSPRLGLRLLYFEFSQKIGKKSRLRTSKEHNPEIPMF